MLNLAFWPPPVSVGLNSLMCNLAFWPPHLKSVLALKILNLFPDPNHAWYRNASSCNCKSNIQMQFSAFFCGRKSFMKLNFRSGYKIRKDILHKVTVRCYNFALNIETLWLYCKINNIFPPYDQFIVAWNDIVCAILQH